MHMKKKLKAIAVTFSLGLSISLILAGCSIDDTDSGSSQGYDYDCSRSWADAKTHARTYKLGYFENRASDDDDNTYYEIGYYKKGELVKANLDKSDQYMEVIEPNCKVPYVQIDKDGKYWIHRPPYNTYNQPPVKGTVTDKE